MREVRPLKYIIKPFDVVERGAVSNNAGLTQQTDTKFAEQLPTRDALVVEDMDNVVVPCPCWERDAQVHGSKKFEQVGVDTALKLLQSSITCAALHPRSVLVICDLNVLTGAFSARIPEAHPRGGGPHAVVRRRQQ